MKNKFNFIYLLMLVFLSSCKNPFIGMIDSENSRIAEEDETGKENSQAVEKSIVTFNSHLQSEDICIFYEINECKIKFSLDDEYESYEWHIGDVIFSKGKQCELDFFYYADGIYPIVVYAQKDKKSYSSIVNVIKNENAVYCDKGMILANENRTIFPCIKQNELTDISLEITSEDGEIIGKGNWSNFSDFSRTKISIDYGLYNFKITAKHKNLSVYFEKVIDINSDEQVIEVYFTFSRLNGNETGGLDITVCFKTQLPVTDAIITVYKKTNTGFVLYTTDSVKKGNMKFEKGRNDNAGYEVMHFIQNNVDYGIYWIRVDSVAANGTKGGYYVSYVHVASGEISKINTNITEYYDLFEIVYENNGGFYTGDSLMTKVSQFDNFILPDESVMKKPGYNFCGWYLDEEMLLPYTKKGIGVVNESLTLYARWIQNNQVVNEGVGLLAESAISVEEKTDGVELNFLLDKNPDLICIDVYDTNGRTLNTEVDYMEKGENNIYSTSLTFNARKNDFYMVEISSFKTTTSTESCIYKEKIYNEKQIFKAMYNH